MLLVTFSVATWYLLSPNIIGIIGSGASFVVTVGLTGFELLIQGLQAYVFTLLAAVYINDAVNAH
jgi:F-type H+-transporting ATPase subunit a